MRVLIIGGTTFFGKRIVEQFLARGDDITVLTRGRRQPPFLRQVIHLTVDRNDHPAFMQAVRGKSFDVVVDNIAYTGGHVEAATEAFTGRTQRYILTSTGSVYGNGARRDLDRRLRLIREEDADLSLHAGEPYGDGKRAAERFLIQHGGLSRGLPFTVIRPPVVMGPEDPTDRVWFYVQRILDGGPILVPVTFPAPLRRHAYSEDLARAYVMAADALAAVDATYNVTMDEIVTLADFVRLLADVMGQETEILEVRAGALEASLSSYRPPFASPFVPDTCRAQHELRARSTPIRDWLRLTAEWLIKQHPEDSTGYRDRRAEIQAAARWTRSAR